ncbi:TPA: hypothetical protein ACHWJ6_001934, partial [Streptococcus suis]
SLVINELVALDLTNWENILYNESTNNKSNILKGRSAYQNISSESCIKEQVIIFFKILSKSSKSHFHLNVFEMTLTNLSIPLSTPQLTLALRAIASIGCFSKKV